MNQDMNERHHAAGGYVSVEHGPGMQPGNNGQQQLQKSNSNQGFSKASLYVKSGNHLQQQPLPTRRESSSSDTCHSFSLIMLATNAKEMSICVFQMMASLASL
jgi:hypothetical protein